MVDEIENYLIDTLEDLAALDGVKIFVKGGLPPNIAIPQQFYPFSEVFCGRSTELGELTGGMFEDQYAGIVTFSVLTIESSLADLAARDAGSRRVELGSYTQVRTLVNAAIQELRKEAHRDLGALATSNEQVVQFWVTEPTYGLDLDTRTNNWSNFGSIPFVVDTQGVF